MKIARLLALTLCTTATLAFAELGPTEWQRKPRFAILNLPDSTYLQMEFDSLPSARVPQIDSVKVEYSGSVVDANSLAVSVANLRVWWSFQWVAASTPAVRVAQITQGLPESNSAPKMGATAVRALRVDTIFSTESGYIGPIKTVSPPHVHNSSAARSICTLDYMCVYEDATQRRSRLVSDFVATWKRSRFGAVLTPTVFMPYVYVSPWSQTTGKEDLTGIVVPMAGNRANWIDVQTQKLMVERNLMAKESVGSTVTVFDIPTGFVRYVYNRTQSPENKILEDGGPRQIDSLLKIGRTLSIEGSSRPYECDIPQVDSTMDDNSWLVLAAGPDNSELAKSLAPAIRGCGMIGRTSAWKASGDTVWLEGMPFSITELVGLATSTAVAPGNRTKDRLAARAVGSATGVSIDLSAGSLVSISNPAGQILTPSRHFDAGRHEIRLGDTRGLLLVRVAQGDRHSTISVLR